MNIEVLAPRLLDGRYEVLSVLGGGGTAVVYLGRHAALGRDVAIKVIRQDVFENEQEVVRYLREARIIAALNHPNIVTLFDVGRLPDERPYMVMEYVAGQSLNRLLKDGAVLPVDLALHVFEQVARALGHAHRHGVIHRDIKPGNILLRDRSTGYPQVKVADFGVASVSSSTVTHQGAFIGTPMYMSPEQAQGQPVVAASDLYSLGILMYKALTGVRPFDSDSPVALAMCHVTERVRPLREVAPDAGVPAELEAVVMRCLEKDPARRYRSADELLVALDVVTARYAPHLHGFSQDSMEVVPVTRTPPARTLALVAALLLLLAFVGGLGAGALFRPEPPVAVPGGADGPISPDVLPADGPDGGPRLPPPAEEPAPDALPGHGRQAQSRRAPPSRSVRAPTGWEGELDGRPVALELSVVGEAATATLDARGLGTDRLVGRMTEHAEGRHVALSDAKKGIVLDLELEDDHAFGTVVAGGRSRRLVLFPR